MAACMLCTYTQSRCMVSGSRELAMIIAFLENKLDGQGLVEAGLDWSEPICRHYKW